MYFELDTDNMESSKRRRSALPSMIIILKSGFPQIST